MNINDLFRPSAPTASAAPATQKTASDNTSSAIKAAMAEALAPSEKVAAEAPNTPEVTLLKLAQDLAAREKLADINHGYRVGEAMSRGFLDGIARAEKVAAAREEGAAKLAAEQEAAYQQGSAEVLNAAREKAAEHYLVGYSMFEGLA